MTTGLIDAALLRGLVDLALFISAAELAWSVWRAPAGSARLAVAAHLCAGLGLMLALRLSLSGPPERTAWAVLVCLSLAGLAHLIDVRLRLAAGAAPCPVGTEPIALKETAP